MSAGQELRIAELEAQLAAEKKLSAAISRDCNECANERNAANARAEKLAGSLEAQVIELNNATSAMRDRPNAGTVDRYWLTNRVNEMRAALKDSP